MLLVLLLGAGLASAEPDHEHFAWPDGNTWALSLSFDDARDSQLETGIPLFDREGVKATFYVLPGPDERRIEEWRAAVTRGHEIGNHTLNHPCTGNFDWVREEHATENYTPQRMRAELEEANRRIRDLLQVTPVSYAYTCGETAVGRGPESTSYLSIVAELFTSGRGWLVEAANNPLRVDLAHVLGMKMDDTAFESLKPVLDAARQKGDWVVLAGHEIARSGAHGPGTAAYTTRLELLEALIQYARAPETRAWLAPVGDVAAHIKRQREAAEKAAFPYQRPRAGG